LGFAFHRMEVSVKNDTIVNIDNKTTEAFKGAFDAMTKWRDEIASSSERHGQQVFDKLGVAAKAAGWPDSLNDATKSQLMQATKMQTGMIDHMVKAWQTQLKSPASQNQFLGSLTQVPGTQVPGTQVPGIHDTVKPIDLTNLALAPTQLLIQSMELWRKNWTDAMSLWSSALQASSKLDPQKRT
jgi:hypothetical protein